ncbi:MAG: hypothetical protein K8H74_14090 [Notoacmeibacter sp.]|nr:hypothetical protein [Notoacmeibacter sp.]
MFRDAGIGHVRDDLVRGMSGNRAKLRLDPGACVISVPIPVWIEDRHSPSHDFGSQADARAPVQEFVSERASPGSSRFRSNPQIALDLINRLI